MKKVLRDRKVVDDDAVKLDDTAPLPASGKIFVSLTRWRAEKDALKARGNVGVAIPGELDVAELKDDLGALPAIALHFGFIKPKPEGGLTFDGRAYSQARLLRQRYGYQGEIRAAGDVFRDTIFAMDRCGVNVIEPRNGLDPQDALNAFKDFSLAYQTAADGQPNIFRRRAP